MAQPNMSALTQRDIDEGLRIAGDLIDAGVPIFAAPPCSPGCGVTTHPPNKPHFALPKHWQKTVPSRVNLERWQPGWALGAIGGFAADFLDVDPRSGGDVTAQTLREQGHWPRTFGRQRSPSGGYHEIITPTGQRKGILAPGVDLQGGVGEAREGLGFVYLSPTVGISKLTGEPIPYIWETPPDLEGLAEWRGADDSTATVIDMMTAKRAEVPAQRTPERGPDMEDPFATQESLTRGGERAFTRAEAQDFVRPHLLALRAAQVGEIEETANRTAAVLSHFVPVFWSPEEAYALLTDALSHTAYDPDHPAATWTAAKFRPVLDGSRPVLDPWKATLRPDPPAPPDLTVPVPEGATGPMSTLERLRAMLCTATDLAQRPAPVPLVYGLLNLNTEAWLIGAPGSLKSFIALDLAAHVGAGREWQGHRVRQGKVLYIAAEGEQGMVLRTRAWEKEFGEMVGVVFLPYPVQVKSGDGQWDALTQLSAEVAPSLIVIDTQHRVSIGLEENSATDMGILIAAVGALRRATGACVLVIHHTGRSGGDARGSSALDGAQDTELKVVRAEPRSSLECALRMDKQKDMAEDPLGVKLRFRVVDLGTDPETGQALSSLVVGRPGDSWTDHEGVDLVDVEPWRGLQPEPWTGRVVSPNAKVKRRILQALADHGGMTGLTEAGVRRVVKDRWENPSDTGWTDAWQAIKDLPALMVNTGGERWTLDEVELRRLKE